MSMKTVEEYVDIMHGDYQLFRMWWESALRRGEQLQERMTLDDWEDLFSKFRCRGMSKVEELSVEEWMEGFNQDQMASIVESKPVAKKKPAKRK